MLNKRKSLHSWNTHLAEGDSQQVNQLYITVGTKRKLNKGLPWQSSGWGSKLPLPGLGSLPGLRSQDPCSPAKKK